MVIPMLLFQITGRYLKNLNLNHLLIITTKHIRLVPYQSSNHGCAERVLRTLNNKEINRYKTYCIRISNVSVSVFYDFANYY